jgi:hypothetical protein
MVYEQENQRESIWSIRQLSLTRYYIAFAALFSLATGLYVWRGFTTSRASTSAIDTALDALKEASGVTPWLIIFTFYLVEGLSVLAERYLRSRYAKGKEEGRLEGKTEGIQEGREEGKEEGREEGREEEGEKWSAWNERREEAIKEGREFSEPPPTRRGSQEEGN